MKPFGMTSRRSKRLSSWKVGVGDYLIEKRHGHEIVLWSGPSWTGNVTVEHKGVLGRRWLIVSREPRGWTRVLSGTGEGVAEGWLEDRATTSRLWDWAKAEEGTS